MASPQRYHRLPKGDIYISPTRPPSNSNAVGISDTHAHEPTATTTTATRGQHIRMGSGGLNINDFQEQKDQARTLGGSYPLLRMAKSYDTIDDDPLNNLSSSDNDGDGESSSLVDDSNNLQQRRRRKNHSNAAPPQQRLFRNHSLNSSSFQDRVLNSGDENQNSETQHLQHPSLRTTGTSEMIGSNHRPFNVQQHHHHRYQDNPTATTASCNTLDITSSSNLHHHHDDQVSNNKNSSSPSNTQSSLVHSPPTTSKINANFSLSFDMNDADWEMDDDDAGLRRYHLEYARPSDIPMPAEFSQPGNIIDLIRVLSKKVWIQFIGLRTAARQRRAARLLTMPSESWRYKLHACLLTWFCDATDAGILLLVCSILVWLLFGIIANAGSRWWTYGIIIFGIRITARRTYEVCWQTHCRSGSSNGTVSALLGVLSSIWFYLIGKTTTAARSVATSMAAASSSSSCTSMRTRDGTTYWMKDSRNEPDSLAVA